MLVAVSKFIGVIEQPIVPVDALIVHKAACVPISFFHAGVQLRNSMLVSEKQLSKGLFQEASLTANASC